MKIPEAMGSGHVRRLRRWQAVPWRQAVTVADVKYEPTASAGG